MAAKGFRSTSSPSRSKFSRRNLSPWAVRLPAASQACSPCWGLSSCRRIASATARDSRRIFSRHKLFGVFIFHASDFALFSRRSSYLVALVFNQSIPRRDKRAPLLYLYRAGIVYGLGFYTYIAYRMTPMLFLLFIPFFNKKPGFWKRHSLFFLVTFLLSPHRSDHYFANIPPISSGRTAEISVTTHSNPVAVFAMNLGKECANVQLARR